MGSSVSTLARAAKSRPAAPGISASTGRWKSIRSLYRTLMYRSLAYLPGSGLWRAGGLSAGCCLSQTAREIGYAEESWTTANRFNGPDPAEVARREGRFGAS